jgi:Domain of unknown function (DUF1772)
MSIPGFVSELVSTASTGLTGLFVGAMLLIAVSLVPYWRGLAPAEFRAWFVAHSGHLGRVMVPLGMAATVGSLLALGLAAIEGTSVTAAAIHAAGLLGVLGVYFACNKPINDLLFAGTGLADGKVADLRRRWAVWHWVRVGLGLVALGAVA